MQRSAREVWRVIQGAVPSQVPVQNTNLGISFPNKKAKPFVTDLKIFNFGKDKDLVDVEDATIAIVNDISLEDGEILEEMTINFADVSLDGNRNSSSKNIIASQPVILNKNKFDIVNNVDEDVNNVEIVMGRSIVIDVNVSSPNVKDMALTVENVRVEKGNWEWSSKLLDQLN
ncbi:hypothetical protein MA16_Dca025475 [Dendrobium catenatum]|uniref:Uncharacterized protein n=1 Tax=Dendrobium catenatum TaxID=906689 RepID=A0A2I0WBX8_9ASPA|nr:hypothetical protein MA16_Dca025475 [Dendrobium catenatum]